MYAARADKGDILMGKTFTLDPISKRRLDNFGEEDQYYVRDPHEAIIPEDVFEKVQEIRQQRHRKTKSGRTSMFSGLVF